MASASDSDVALVALVVAGSEAALGLLYDRYADAVYGHARRLLGDAQSAEEIVQETFLALWNRADTFNPEAGSVAAWLRSIGRHRVVDRLRAGGRGPRVLDFSDLQYAEDDDEAAALEHALAGSEPAGSAQPEAGPEESAIAHEIRREIRAALATLPEEERAVIELAYAEGLSQSQIAARLGWPIGTVKTRTRRALRGLRAALGEGFADEARERAEGQGEADDVEAGTGMDRGGSGTKSGAAGEGDGSR